jgi:hypothetical protein
VVQLGFGFDAPAAGGESSHADPALNDSGGASNDPGGKGQDAGGNALERVAAQAPASLPSPVPSSPARGAAEGAKKRARLSPEERAARDAEKARIAAEKREKKKRGEDMLLLPELQREWREAVAARRGVKAETIIITGRALPSARGYLARVFMALCPDRTPTEEDRAYILRETRATFDRALATERPGYPLGLAMVLDQPDRYQGTPQSQPPRSTLQRANVLTEERRRASLYVVPDDAGDSE